MKFISSFVQPYYSTADVIIFCIMVRIMQWIMPGSAWSDVLTARGLIGIGAAAIVGGTLIIITTVAQTRRWLTVHREDYDRSLEQAYDLGKSLGRRVP